MLKTILQPNKYRFFRFVSKVDTGNHLKKISSIKKVPYLFTILCVALGILMAFQISWLLKSKRLIEDQFDQKVNMAIGSALSDFNLSHHTNLQSNGLGECVSEENLTCIPSQGLSTDDRQELESLLQGHMAYYGIDEKYSVSVNESSGGEKSPVASSVISQPKNDGFSCSLSEVKGCKQGSVLTVNFTGRDDYLYDQMVPMILSSVLIFLLLASVSFIILWSLIKQKRITANNIDFFNNTAHELKTPLTNISLALKLLTKKHTEIAGDKYTEIIKSENTRLSDQIERVLFLSKMENGEYVMEKKEIDLGSLLHEVVEAMSMAVAERNGTIRLDLHQKGAMILGDYFHLGNVFRNLIDNAIKYCDKDPEITISTTEDNHHVKVIVADNGIGISSQDQSHIFEKFQRVGTGDVYRTKGFGIGLAYVKTVVELHKGLVQVKSELDKGSQFQLLIPNT